MNILLNQSLRIIKIIPKLNIKNQHFDFKLDTINFPDSDLQLIKNPEKI